MEQFWLHWNPPTIADHVSLITGGWSTAVFTIYESCPKWKGKGRLITNIIWMASILESLNGWVPGSNHSEFVLRCLFIKDACIKHIDILLIWINSWICTLFDDDSGVFDCTWPTFLGLGHVFGTIKAVKNRRLFGFQKEFVLLTNYTYCFKLCMRCQNLDKNYNYAQTSITQCTHNRLVFKCIRWDIG